MARTRPQPDANDAVSAHRSDEADTALAGYGSAECDDPLGCRIRGAWLCTCMARGRCLRRIRSGDLDPPIGDPVQVDQVARIDLACGAQTLDHLLDQDGVILGQFDDGRCDAPPVAIDQHAELPVGCGVWTEVRNRTGRSRTGMVDARARPEPPRSLHTGRWALVKVTAFMGFSFAMKGNAQPGRGTWGSPFGMLREAERFFARQAVRRVEGPHPLRGCRPSLGAGQCVTVRQAINFSSVADGASGQQVTRPGRAGSAEGR